MTRLLTRILSAESLDDAREIATTDSRLAAGVLRRARIALVDDESLELASLRLNAYHGRVARAGSREEVANALSSTFQPSVQNCSYSTGEIIAIVLGLILGIIPGIILLILLC
jgi:hypothetical protein